MSKTEESILSALRAFGRRKDAGEECVIIRRSDHPYVDGDYFYAIAPAEKRHWTAGEHQLTQDEVAALWYGADCPPWR